MGRHQQLAQHYLRRWGYYEESMNDHLFNESESAVGFFKCLQSLTSDELILLAKRWYESKNKVNFCVKLGRYISVKPTTYNEVSQL